MYVLADCYCVQASEVVQTYPSSSGRQLLQQYSNNCRYRDQYGNIYDNCRYWSGGRLAGIIVGIVCFVCAILFCSLAMALRRKRMASSRMVSSKMCLDTGADPFVSNSVA